MYFAAVRSTPAVRISLLTCGAKALEPLSPCLQNTCDLSDTVAHLGLRSHGVVHDRLASDPVVVRFGGQPWRRCRAPYLLDMETAAVRRELLSTPRGGRDTGCRRAKGSAGRSTTGAPGRW